MVDPFSLVSGPPIFLALFHFFVVVCSYLLYTLPVDGLTANRRCSYPLSEP